MYVCRCGPRRPLQSPSSDDSEGAKKAVSGLATVEANKSSGVIHFQLSRHYGAYLFAIVLIILTSLILFVPLATFSPPKAV